MNTFVLRNCNSYNAVQSSGVVYLRDTSPKDNKWDVHKAQNDIMAALYAEAEEFQALATRMSNCANFIQFGLWADSGGTLIHKLASARFCHARFCPTCQWRRSLTWIAKFMLAFPKLVKDYPEHSFIFLTLTVKNVPVTDLRTTVQDMNKAWKRLTELKCFPAVGFIRNLEVTRAWECYFNGKYLGRHGITWVHQWEKRNGKKLRLEPTDEVHPHFHCVLMVPKTYFKKGYISHAKWVELWQQSLRVDYLPTVDVRRVKSSKNQSESDSNVPELDFINAVLEVAKYTVKTSDLSADFEFLCQITKQMHKLRAISIGGLIKDYIDDSEPTDLVHTGLDDLSDEELTDTGHKLWYRWNRAIKRYQLC